MRTQTIWFADFGPIHNHFHWPISPTSHSHRVLKILSGTNQKHRLGRIEEEILVRTTKRFGFVGFALLVIRNSAANYTKIKCMNNSNGCCGQQPETRRRATTAPKLIIQKGQKDPAQRMWGMVGNWVSCFVFTLHFIALTLWHNEYKYLDSKNSSNGMSWQQDMDLCGNVWTWPAHKF